MQNICLESQFAESLTIDPEGLVAKRCPEQQFAKLAKCAAGWSRYRKFVQNNILQKKGHDCAYLCVLIVVTLIAVSEIDFDDFDV